MRLQWTSEPGLSFSERNASILEWSAFLSSYHMSGKVQGFSTMRRRALGPVRGAEIPLPVMIPLPLPTCPILETDSLPLLHADVREATNLPDGIPGEFSYCLYGMNFREDCFEIRSDDTSFSFDP
jgi:hypothetical protein